MRRFANLTFLFRLFFSMTGICLIALGVATMTRSSLGCTPIAAIPYSMSLLPLPLSYGTWVCLFNISLVALQWLLLSGRISKAGMAVQCLLACAFGLFVDIFMALVGNIAGQIYPVRILGVLAGTMLIAAGAATCVISRGAILPGDGLTIALQSKYHGELGKIRIVTDVLMAIGALAICLPCFGGSPSVGEGTLIAAILTGFFVKLFMRGYSRLRERKDAS